MKTLNLSFKIFTANSAMCLSMVMAFIFGVSINSRFVFVIYSYYNILRTWCGWHFPFGAFHLVELNNSFERLQRYFVHNLQTNPISTTNTKTNLSFEDITAKWKPILSQTCLREVNFEASSGKVTALIGASGSGKSAILHTILGETSIVKGKLSVEGKISFASQEPWIFPATVRQNILFGETFDESRYSTVMKVCQLEHDVSLFPNGDLSSVGERGVLLSGGQKARLNLARAVYRTADIYLLDDPLSAVDSFVAKQIFENCILSFLSNKCVIWATHQVNFLKMVHKVYAVDKGKVTKQEMKPNDLRTHLLNNIALEETKKISLEKLKSLNENCRDEQNESIMNILFAYCKTFGFLGSLLLLFLFLVAQFLINANDFFLRFWINLHQILPQKLLNDDIQTVKTEEYFSTINFLCINAAVCFATAVFVFMRTALFAFCCSKRSKVLHHLVLKKVSSATLQFFNMEQSGVILNKFSKDMGIMDNYFPLICLNIAQNSLQILGGVLLISITNYVCVLPTIAFLGLVMLIIGWFSKVLEQAKATEITTKNPIFTQVVVTVQGLTTIGAFNAKETLIKEFDKLQSKNGVAVYLKISLNFVMGVVADCLCILYMLGIFLCLYFLELDASEADVGLILVQVLGIFYMVQGVLKESSELSLSCLSVAHIQKYLTLPSEGDEGTLEPPKHWLSDGNIIFSHLNLQYPESRSLVLKNISIEIHPKEKIGIIGRTGSGKSSLISTLFRLHKFTGNITVDKLNIGELPLKTLRTSLAIIPQNPVLFSGTIRKNLDPFDNFTDIDVWQALEEVDMKTSICSLSNGLETNVQESGSNFSSGERQLLCLARAVLRKTRILIMDEVSASVDLRTDQLIQATIRRKFIDSTLLIITHKLHTVMDSDRILVLQDGEVVEFDSPYKLLQKPNGYLYNQVMKNGEEVMEELLNRTTFKSSVSL